MFKILLFLLVFYPVISNAKEIVSDGISKTYHSNGKLEKEIPYKNGKKDSKNTFFNCKSN